MGAVQSRGVVSRRASGFQCSSVPVLWSGEQGPVWGPSGEQWGSNADSPGGGGGTSAAGPCSVPGGGEGACGCHRRGEEGEGFGDELENPGVAQHHVHVGVGLGAQDGSPLGADTTDVRVAAFHHQVRDGFLGDAWRVVKGGAGWGRWYWGSRNWGGERWRGRLLCTWSRGSWWQLGACKGLGWWCLRGLWVSFAEGWGIFWVVAVSF